MKDYLQSPYFNELFCKEQSDVGCELRTYLGDLMSVVRGLSPLSEDETKSFLRASRKHIEDVAEEHGFNGHKKGELLNDFYTRAIRIVVRNS